MATIQVLTENYPPGTATPGCYFCGSDRRKDPQSPDGQEPIISFGIDIDFEGRPYMCASCLIEAYDALRKVVPDNRTEDLRKGRRADGLRIANLQERLTTVEDAYGALRNECKILREENAGLRKSKASK